MIFSKSDIGGVCVIDLEPRMDERGFFARTFCAREFEAHGLNPYMLQCNVSFSQSKATLRGMHYQIEPYAEDKLVRCLSGQIFDVAVDLRPDSKTYCQWFGLELSVENNRALYVPRGCAHGFMTLTDNALVQYQVSNYFEPNAERGLRWDDPAIGIKWPLFPQIISEKDQRHPLL
jgi:dTDP-4-dehydrorhamnose 3,5-epimerase